MLQLQWVWLDNVTDKGNVLMKVNDYYDDGGIACRDNDDDNSWSQWPQ